jgi:hypothetical protein
VLGTALALFANNSNNNNNGFSMTHVELSPNSEVGRENMGLLVVAFWFSLLRADDHASAHLWYGWVVFLTATGLCGATVLVPMLLVNKDELVEHCSGMGPFQ